MRNLLLTALYLLLTSCFISCSSEDIVEGFTKIEFEGSQKCTTSNQLKQTINKRLGTVTIYKDKEFNNAVSIYLEDKDHHYNACMLPEEYQKDGLIIMFSGNIYYPDPTANTYNPLKGLDFEITDLWVKK